MGNPTPSGMNDDQPAKAEDTRFVRLLNCAFRRLGHIIAKWPWIFITVSTALTIATSVKIPLTEMVNDVSDYTPYAARSRKELQVYEKFFSNEGEPLAVYVLITGKQNNSMFGVRQLGESVRILDIVSNNFTIYDSEMHRHLTFNQFCRSFCLINEPIRHFYHGLEVTEQFHHSGNNKSASPDHIDLGYPITTILGRQIHLDPNFFGVKIAAPSETNGNRLVEIQMQYLKTQNGLSIFDNDQVEFQPLQMVDFQGQYPNNIRDIKLVILQFRAERPKSWTQEAVKRWEGDVVNFFYSEFQSDYVNALVLTPTYLTSEIVRAGLSLLPFLVIGFSVMVVFSTTTATMSALYMRQMNVHKITLAIMACVTPFMACGTALGLMFWMGIRFGSILCVTPFLVLAIGVDDAYLMLNSWQRLTAQYRSHHSSRSTENSKIGFRIGEMLADTGPSITITSLTNMLAFGIGALTPTPEIQLFCLGNAIAIFMDFVYQITIFGASMAVLGNYELSKENRTYNLQIVIEKEIACSTSDKTSSSSMETVNCRTHIDIFCRRFLVKYCGLLTSKIFSLITFGILMLYWYISIIGTVNMKAELNPQKLFLPRSNMVKLIDLRNNYIIPYYSICTVFVNQPGNLSDPWRVNRLHEMVDDFERLPMSLGKFSTKFWMRDYEKFVQYSQEVQSAVPIEFESDEEEPAVALEFTQSGSRPVIVKPTIDVTKNELQQFLDWPEFEFWKGFVRYDNDENLKQYNLTRFFFTTAFHGVELHEWSNRANLLNEWRKVADKYSDFEVSVYDDDAKFLDLIATMWPVTWQTSICTLICMFMVCLMFITHWLTVFVATVSIVSTCIGVFGILGWWGVDLDPIVMSATVMSIGFSVDIPAHISYHYYRTGNDPTLSHSVQLRLEHCLAAIGFPVLQAGLSTLICTCTLLFVELHMSLVFVKTMALVVVIGMLHGLLIIPVLFNIFSFLPKTRIRRATISTQQFVINPK